MNFKINQNIVKLINKVRYILPMVEIAITKISSKGQIVIPSSMRKDFKEGESMVIMKNGTQLIIKTVKDFDKNIKDDLIFAQRTEKAWKSYERGEFIEMNFYDFLKEIKKW